MNRRTFLQRIFKASLVATAAGVIVPRGTAAISQMFVGVDMAGPVREGWVAERGVITARYVMDGNRTTVKVMADGKSYGSLMEAARAIAQKRGYSSEQVRLYPEDEMESFDVHVGQEGSIHVRKAVFENMPMAEVAKTALLRRQPNGR